MTTEEKAKVYDEALRKAKKLYEQGTITESLSYVFPELAESENERIRKALVEMVHDTTGDELWVDYNVHKEDAIAWLEKQGDTYTKKDVDDAWLKGIGDAKRELEKQGEQKPEPKFKVGDWVKHNETKEAFFIKGMGKAYCMEDIAGITENNPTKIVDELSTIWTIQDAKDGDVLSVTMDPEGTWIGIFKEHNGGTFSSHCFVNCDGIFKIGVSGHGNVNAIHPATKEQRDQLFSKMKGAGYEWDFVKKQLKKIEQ